MPALRTGQRDSAFPATARRRFEHAKLGALLAIAGLVAACAPDPTPPTGSVRRFLDGSVEIVETRGDTWTGSDAWLVAPGPALEIGVEEGAPEYMFSSVEGAVRLPDGRLVVADRGSSELRFFDDEGVLLGRAGRHGQGPGEFEYIMALYRCVPDRLYVLEIPFEVSAFDLEGELLESFGLTGQEGLRPPYAETCNARGQWLTTGWGERPPGVVGFYRTTTRASLIGVDHELESDLGEVPGSERIGTTGGSGPHPFGRATVVALGDERAYIGTADTFEIAVYGLDGRLHRRIRRPGLDLELSTDLADRYRQWALAREPAERAEDARVRLANMEFPESIPAYTALVLDPGDHLWAQRFAPPWAEVQEWAVIAPDGVHLGEVRLPARFTATEIGDDYVLGVFRDELDTEYVRMYRIVRPRDS